jgi:hypothetical protein
MKKRKYILIFGAALTTLLLISSATAVNYTNNQTDENITGDDPTFGEETATPGTQFGEETATPGTQLDEEEGYIDPNIELTSTEHLTGLQTILSEIDDPEFKLFTQELINELNNDEKVDAQDIRNIRDSNGIFTDWRYYAGGVDAHAGDSVFAGGFPFIIRPFAGCAWKSWPGPGLYVRWDCSWALMAKCYNFEEMDVTVGLGTIVGEGVKIEEYHKGIAFFQFGWWAYTVGWNGGMEKIFDMIAVSPLIVINPD